MPRYPTISKAGGGPGTANVKESRDKEREIISSSSRAILTHSCLPFLKKNCSKTPLFSIPLSLAFLFWIGAQLHLVPLPSFHSKLSCITVMVKGGPMNGKDFWRGQWAAPALGSAQESRSQTATHVVEITASLQPLQFSPQQPPKFHWQKKIWGGGRRSQKNYCVPREGKRRTALFSLSSFADVNHFSHFKQERHHFSPPVPLFIMLCISHELSLMQNLYIVRGHPNIFNDLKQSDWH